MQTHDSRREIRSRPAPHPGSALGRSLFRYHLALRLPHQFLRIHRPLDVLRLLLRPHPAHSNLQGRLLHDTPDLDRPRRSGVPLVLPAGCDLRSASGGLLRVDPAALSDSESHREPVSGAAGDHHDGVPLLLFVERRLAVHRRRRQHVRAAHASLSRLCRAGREPQVVAPGHRRRRREDGLLPVLSDLFFPADLRLLLLRAPPDGPSPIHGGIEALRLGICPRDRALRRLQHGHQRPFSLLHQLGGNGREDCHPSQPLQRFHISLDQRRNLAGRPGDSHGGSARVRLATTKPPVDSERRIPIVLAAISLTQLRDHDLLAVDRPARLATPHLRELPHAGRFPRPRISDCHRHSRAQQAWARFDLRRSIPRWRPPIHPATGYPFPYRAPDAPPLRPWHNRTGSGRKADQTPRSHRDRGPCPQPGHAQRRHQHAHMESRLSASRRRFSEIRLARDRRQHPHRAVTRPQRQSLLLVRRRIAPWPPLSRRSIHLPMGLPLAKRVLPGPGPQSPTPRPPHFDSHRGSQLCHAGRERFSRKTGPECGRPRAAQDSRGSIRLGRDRNPNNAAHPKRTSAVGRSSRTRGARNEEARESWTGKLSS